MRQELGEIQEKNRFIVLLDSRVIKLYWGSAVCLRVTQYLLSVHLKNTKKPNQNKKKQKEKKDY